MLQSIRNVVTGWVAVVFVVLLIIPFAFWGIDSYFGSGVNVNIAEVNGVDITLPEYQRSFQNIRQQWQEISPELAEQTEFLKQQTLDSLIDRVLLLELKESVGFRVSDEQVRAAIYEIQVFRNPEGFDTVRYQNYLRTMGYSPAQFEMQMREDMTLQQLQSGLLETIFVSPSEITTLAALDNEMRDIQYAQLYFSDVEAEIEVTDAEVEAYYNENNQDFMSPEEARIAYIHLSIDNIAAQISVDEQALVTFFENTRANYSITERRKVRQILVYADNEDEESTKRAEAVANEIRAQVVSGVTFEQARDQYADDEQITVEISDFGFLNPGVLDTEINDVVFSIEPGIISEPILSEYGYQLVVVDEITGGTVPELEDVRTEVAREYRREQAEKRFFDLYDELAVLTYEHPETLEVAAESLGIPVRESLPITRSGANEALLNDPKITAATFSDEVLLDGNNSQLIELGPNQIIVLRVIEHNRQQLKPLDEVRDQVTAQIRRQKGLEITRNLAEEIKAKVEQGISLEALAEQYQIEWREELELKRDGYYVDEEILEAAFKAGRPAEGQLAVAVTPVGEGDYAVIIVNSVHEIDPSTLTAEQIDPVSDYIRQSSASKSWSLMMQDLKANAQITIFEENLL